MKTYRINKNAARLAQGTGFAPELIYNISLVRFQGRNGRCIAAWTPGMKRPRYVYKARTPEEYERWIYSVGREAAEFEIVELLSIARDQKVIVDTNIPIDILKEISDYHHVAAMVSPQSMSVERFFDRSDPEKQFLLGVIESCDDLEAVMANYKKGLALINSQKHYDEYVDSGFFTLVREDSGKDTREYVCGLLEKHFKLI